MIKWNGYLLFISLNMKLILTHIYSQKHVNKQGLTFSHEQPPQSMCLWVGMRHDILMIINKWKVYKDDKCHLN